jgi:TPR repeat protein
MRPLIVIALSLLLVTLPAIHADDLEKDTVLAEAGDYDAMLRVGSAYLSDQVEANNTDGIAWLEMSSSGGNVTAYLHLGVAYQEGSQIKKDASKAVMYLTLAAELGEPRAMNRLAGIYFVGELIPANDILAVKWALLASELGKETSQKNLEAMQSQIGTREKVLGGKAASAWMKRRSLPKTP